MELSIIGETISKLYVPLYMDIFILRSFTNMFALKLLLTNKWY